MKSMVMSHELDFGSERLAILYAEVAHHSQLREARASSVRKPVLRSVLGRLIETLATADTELLSSSPHLISPFRRW